MRLIRLAEMSQDTLHTLHADAKKQYCKDKSNECFARDREGNMIAYQRINGEAQASDVW
jgi:hypothetical protein